MERPLSPARDWNMAECSESTGTIGALCSIESSIILSPATTNVSLLAKAIFLEFFMALTVGNNPAKPTMAVTTVSTSEEPAAYSMDSSPANTFIMVSERASRTCG